MSTETGYTTEKFKDVVWRKAWTMKIVFPLKIFKMCLNYFPIESRV